MNNKEMAKNRAIASVINSVTNKLCDVPGVAKGINNASYEPKDDKFIFLVPHHHKGISGASIATALKGYEYEMVDYPQHKAIFMDASTLINDIMETDRLSIFDPQSGSSRFSIYCMIIGIPILMILVACMVLWILNHFEMIKK